MNHVGLVGRLVYGADSNGLISILYQEFSCCGTRIKSGHARGLVRYNNFDMPE
jgi:hypothetical protein